MRRIRFKHLLLACLALVFLLSPSAFAQYEPFAKKPKPPAFTISPAADTFQPGDEITLTSTAKKNAQRAELLSGRSVTDANTD
jgi:hypothetical protein